MKVGSEIEGSWWVVMNSKGNNLKIFDCLLVSEGNYWIFILINKVNKMKKIWILFGNIIECDKISE